MCSSRHSTVNYGGDIKMDTSVVDVDGGRAFPGWGVSNEHADTSSIIKFSRSISRSGEEGSGAPADLRWRQALLA